MLAALRRVIGHPGAIAAGERLGQQPDPEQDQARRDDLGHHIGADAGVTAGLRQAPCDDGGADAKQQNTD